MNNNKNNNKNNSKNNNKIKNNFNNNSNFKKIKKLVKSYCSRRIRIIMINNMIKKNIVNISLKFINIL